MNTNKLQRIIRAGAIVFSLIFAIGIFSTDSQAQRRNNHRNKDKHNHKDNHNRRDNRNDNDRYNNRDNDNRYENNRQNRNNDYNNIYRGSVQHGYQDGLSVGAADARNGRRANAQRAASRQIRQATGNNPGPTASYYREGFIRGYNEGYNRYDNDNDDNDDYDYDDNR